MSRPSDKAGMRRTAPQKVFKVRSAPGKDRWILSYADFITLLFAFFVAMYSIAIQNDGDKIKMSETLEGVFDAVQKSVKPINIGDPSTNKVESEVMFEVNPAETNTAEQPGIEIPEVESEVFSQLSQLVANELQDFQASGLISISEDTNWIEVDMKAGLLFGSGEYELTNDAVAVLMSITGILTQFPSPILVQGHTDDLPINSPTYTTNWHLSSQRASSVVDEMIFRGINPINIAPIGFSSTVPKVRNANEFARERNRRVTLKISKSKDVSLHDYLFN